MFTTKKIDPLTQTAVSLSRTAKQGGLSLGLVLSLAGGTVLPAAAADSVCGPKNIEAVASYFSTATASAPQNYRNAYQHFPSREIPAAAKPFGLTAGQPLGKVDYSYEGKERSLDDFLKSTRSNAFLVLHDGQILQEQYFNGASQQSHFLINSMTKSLVGLLVGVAVEQGKIASLDDPITRYLPELAHSAYATATVRQVLDMTTAMQFAGQNPEAAGRGRDIEAAAGKSFGCNQSIRQHPTTALYSERSHHGERFTYINTNTQVLGMLVERVTGTSLSQFMENNIWSRIGTESSAYWLLDQTDKSKAIEHAWVGLNARLRDLGRMGMLLAHGGEWQGQQLISKAWINESMHPSEPFLQQLPERPLFGYSHQWWVPVGGEGEFMGIGFGGQYLYVNQPKQLVVVQLSTNPAYDPKKTSEETLAAFRAIATKL
ncbi:serine hydrolase domain-containing protein [Pseudomonas putida]|uniref:serine hydrolase domain-containing protein n=1 Tax=Pseudomonas putida TaxID=303 RepID=UPI0023E3A720|nr:serine hydrolase [Pseudomonas putida]MDF3927980.1 serine hydrolase [Pseudomonas putida]